MDAAVAVALVFAGLALGIAIGALVLAMKGGGTGAGAAGSETLHRAYSSELDKWISYELIPFLKKVHAAVKDGDPGQLPDPGIKNPPPPPGGGD
jgi:hypothetical protein